MYTLTLTYPSGDSFIVGGFSSENLALQWIANAQASNQWQEGTTYVITAPPQTYIGS